jgi:hypothetical protein
MITSYLTAIRCRLRILVDENTQDLGLRITGMRVRKTQLDSVRFGRSSTMVQVLDGDLAVAKVGKSLLSTSIFNPVIIGLHVTARAR